MRKKTSGFLDILEYIFKEEGHANNLSIQCIREDLTTVNLSMNANGDDSGPLFDSVVGDLKIK